MTDDIWSRDEPNGSLRCLLIPFADGELLLPSSAVAEVLPDVAVQSVEDFPSWLLGFFSWQFTPIPLIAFEAFLGGEAVTEAGGHKVVIFHTLFPDEGLRFYGMVVRGIPHLVQVREGELTLLPEAANEAVRYRVEVQGRVAVIPALDWLEGRLREVLTSRAVDDGGQPGGESRPESKEYQRNQLDKDER